MYMFWPHVFDLFILFIEIILSSKWYSFLFLCSLSRWEIWYLQRNIFSFGNWINWANTYLFFVHYTLSNGQKNNEFKSMCLKNALLTIFQIFQRAIVWFLRVSNDLRIVLTIIINFKMREEWKRHIQIPNGKDSCLPCCGQPPLDYLLKTFRWMAL